MNRSTGMRYAFHTSIYSAIRLGERYFLTVLNNTYDIDVLACFIDNQDNEITKQLKVFKAFLVITNGMG